MDSFFKEILKIIGKLLLAILPVAIVLIVLINVFPMRYFDKEYAWYKENIEYAQNTNDYARVLIMGDSLGKADYMPELLSNDTYNYALGGASIAEEYYYLIEFLKNNKAPEYIVYSTDVNRFMVFDTLWTRSVYFHRLAKEDLLEIIDIAKSFEETSYISDEKIKKINQYYCWSPIIYGSTVMSGIINPVRYKENIIKYNDVILNKGETQFNDDKSNNEINSTANYEGFETIKTQDYYFKKLIELCNENNIQFIYKVVPVNEATFENLNSNFINEYHEYLDGIKSLYPNVIMDYEYVAYPAECFGDPSHLNDEGILRFNKEFKEQYSYIFKEN